MLAYHLAGAETGAAVDLPAEAFREQLDELAASGRVISLAAAVELLERRQAAQDQKIVLTFDDAFRNFYEIAWPLLAERGLPAELYVPVGFIDGTAPAPLTGAEQLPAMTWDQIREVSTAGLVAVGSHTMSHPDLRTLAAADCRSELESSRERLEDEIGRSVPSFCYPKGLWSASVRDLVAERFESAVAAGGRRNRPGEFDRFSISRLPLRSDMPRSLSPILEKGIWLEEWAASGLRRLRHR